MKIRTYHCLTAEKVRNCCIKYNYYTRGTNEEYALMLSQFDDDKEVDDELLTKAVTDIYDHSDFIENKPRSVFYQMTEEEYKEKLFAINLIAYNLMSYADVQAELVVEV